MKNTLSEKMIEILKVMKKYNSKLIKMENDLWSCEGSDMSGWNCNIITLRALEARGLVLLNEEEQLCTLI